MNDTYWGQIPVAVIKGNASKKDLKKLCMEKLSSYKIPRKWFFVEDMPLYDKRKDCPYAGSTIQSKPRRSEINRAVIVQAKRTPIGKKDGMFWDTEPHLLARTSSSTTRERG